MLKRISGYIVSCCVSFTVCVMVLSVAHSIDGKVMEFYGWKENFHLFACCFSISFLMFFTDKLTEKYSLAVELLVKFADVVACVFGLGGLIFRWFPIDLKWSIYVFALALIIYIITFIITIFSLYFANEKTSNEINKKIAERKMKYEQESD